MRALTLRQPWASLVAAGVKTIETRGWSTPYRGPLLIHAGKLVEPGRVGRWTVWNESGAVWWLDGRDGDPASSDYDPLPLGAVVAVCTLADVVPIAPGPGAGPACIRVFHHPAALLGDDPAGSPVVHRNFTDQMPYGDFTPGRYAWLLADVRPLGTPVPAKGRQGLWTPDALLADAIRGAVAP